MRTREDRGGTEGALPRAYEEVHCFAVRWWWTIAILWCIDGLIVYLAVDGLCAVLCVGQGFFALFVACLSRLVGKHGQGFPCPRSMRRVVTAQLRIIRFASFLVGYGGLAVMPILHVCLVVLAPDGLMVQ